VVLPHYFVSYARLFPVADTCITAIPLRRGGFVSLDTAYVSNLLKVVCSGQMSVEPETSRLQIKDSTTRLLHPGLGNC